MGTRKLNWTAASTISRPAAMRVLSLSARLAYVVPRIVVVPEPAQHPTEFHCKVQVALVTAHHPHDGDRSHSRGRALHGRPAETLMSKRKVIIRTIAFFLLLLALPYSFWYRLHHSMTVASPFTTGDGSLPQPVLIA